MSFRTYGKSQGPTKSNFRDIRLLGWFGKSCLSFLIFKKVWQHVTSSVCLWLIQSLRGAWRDRDTNDIFAHSYLIFYFLDFKFSNFVCLSELYHLIWFFFKNSFRKKKNIQKTTQNALAPSIFIVFFNRAETWYTASTHPSAKYVVTEFLISL